LEARRVKQNGVHYTPDELARFLAERAILHLAPGNGPIRVLDPACGDGSLLRAIYRATPAKLRPWLILYGCDSDPLAIEAACDRLTRLHAVAELRAGDFLSLGAPLPPADLIISNPPYVRTQVLGARRARQLARRFNLSGRLDLYHAFVAASAAALQPDGVLALLTSNRFLSIQSGAAMRQLLRGEFDLKELYDLGDTKLFGAAVLPAIVIARKAAARGGCTFCRVYETTADVRAATRFDHVLDALRGGHEGILRVGRSHYRVARGRLEANGKSNAPWLLSSADSRAWLKTVHSRTKCHFGDVAEVRVGIKTTADNVFIRKHWAACCPPPEDELLRPLLTHHVAARWRVRAEPASRVLYPHAHDESGRRVAIDLARYPRAAAYLRKQQRQLAGRKYVLDAGRAWYEIWVPQQPRDWIKPKIVWPDISQSPTFFLDTSGAIVNGDCYWMTLRDGADDPRWLYMMLAVANSTFIERFYDTLFHNKLYAGRRRFMTQYVRQFPLPAIDDAIVERVRALVAGPPDADAETALDTMVCTAFS
jgi:SAM-dependent methyltransferase